MDFDINLKKCIICPLECKTDRTKARGSCGADNVMEISSWNLHFGEEPPISGHRGSGTIFFTHCSLKCSFCQNYPISHLGNGNKVTEKEFIDIMLKLQDEGAHNINFVTPTHYTLHIIKALDKIKPQKLNIPVVYNCGGYERIETLKALEGLIDIYMPDAKFASSEAAAKLSKAKDYWETNKEALKEMHRQVGDLRIDSTGVAGKGLLIRHLVLPGNLSGTQKVLKFIAKDISDNTYLSLMSQYHPAHDAVGDKVLGKRLTWQEYNRAVKYAKELGLKNCYIQEL